MSREVTTLFTHCDRHRVTLKSTRMSSIVGSWNVRIAAFLDAEASTVADLGMPG